MDFNFYILIILICGIIAGIWWMMRRGKKLLDEQNRVLQNSRRAKARIIEIGKSVVQVRNGTVIVKLRMDVMQNELTEYGTSTVWEVTQANLSQIQPGQIVSIRIDPENNKLIYPNVGWAKFSRTYHSAWIKDK